MELRLKTTREATGWRRIALLAAIAPWGVLYFAAIRWDVFNWFSFSLGAVAVEALVAIGVWILLAACFCWLDRVVVQDYKNTPWVVAIFDDPVEGFRSALSEIVEKAVLFRWDFMGYWNGISGPPRLLSAAMNGAFLALCVWLLVNVFALPGLGEDGGKLIGALVVTTIGLIDWRERSSMYQKWRYLAGLYNDVIRIDQSKNRDDTGDEDAKSGSRDTRRELDANLAIDILMLGMWAHRSFRNTFSLSLGNAVQFCADSHDSLGTEWREKVEKHIREEGLTRRQAHVLLSLHLYKFDPPEKDELKNNMKTQMERSPAPFPWTPDLRQLCLTGVNDAEEKAASLHQGVQG